jgi:Phytanoyl-CoA dioxygenase (PhyH)
LSKLSRRVSKRIDLGTRVDAVKTFASVTLTGHSRVWLHRHRRRLSRAVTSAMRRRLPTAMRYYAHDWLLTNRESRRLYQTAAPALDSTQQAIVDDLTRTGLAVVSFDQLFRGRAQWQRLDEDAAAFRREAESRLGDSASSITKAKSYLWRRYTRDVELSFRDEWLRLATSCRVLDVVNSYLGLFAKLIYVDQWYTPPTGALVERVASQRWHRDFTDRHLVKVFIYLSDVDDRNGPFQYVRESAAGRYSRLWPWRPLGLMYPPVEQFARKVPASAIATVTGRAGTVIFCDTSGFHRGGFATDRSRMVAVFNYASPACLHSLTARNFHIAPTELRSDLPPAVRFTLA